MTGLVSVLREMQTRLMRLLAEIDQDELLDVLIQINEHVRVVLDWYKAVKEKKNFQVPPFIVPRFIFDVDSGQSCAALRGVGGLDHVQVLMLWK